MFYVQTPGSADLAAERHHSEFKEAGSGPLRLIAAWCQISPRSASDTLVPSPMMM